MTPEERANRLLETIDTIATRHEPSIFGLPHDDEPWGEMTAAVTAAIREAVQERQ